MATLNIGGGFADLRARELSNLTIRPFVLDEIEAYSVEGLLQGIKLRPGDPHREMTFKMAGVKAKRMGEQAENQWVWWNGEQIAYGSKEHHTLLERAIRASFEQNPLALAILYSTRGMELIHDLGTPESQHTSLPADVFCDILTRLRDEGDALAHRRQAEQLHLIQTLSLSDAQAAARMIEIDGQEAYRTVTKRYGQDAALLLIVAHLRRDHGSMNSFPPDPNIDGQVEETLRKMHIDFT